MENLNDNILSLIDKYVVRYNMTDSSIIVYPGYNDIVVNDGCCCDDESALPEGGGPGYYLTKNEYGDLVWKMLENCLTWKKFVTGSSDTNPVPYVFTLDSPAEKIFQVVVNGQVIDPYSYTHEEDKVYVDSPTILDYATVVIYTACSSMTIGGGGLADAQKQTYIWNEGDSYSFTTSLPVGSIDDVYLNGQRLKDGVDYTFVEGESWFTIISPPNYLDDQDEIDIEYSSTFDEDPDPVEEGVFDDTFDETFA